MEQQRGQATNKSKELLARCIEKRRIVLSRVRDGKARERAEGLRNDYETLIPFVKVCAQKHDGCAETRQAAVEEAEAALATPACVAGANAEEPEPEPEPDVAALSPPVFPTLLTRTPLCAGENSVAARIDPT